MKLAVLLFSLLAAACQPQSLAIDAELWTQVHPRAHYFADRESHWIDPGHVVPFMVSSTRARYAYLGTRTGLVPIWDVDALTGYQVLSKFDPFTGATQEWEAPGYTQVFEQRDQAPAIQQLGEVSVEVVREAGVPGGGFTVDRPGGEVLSEWGKSAYPLGLEEFAYRCSDLNLERREMFEDLHLVGSVELDSNPATPVFQLVPIASGRVQNPVIDIYAGDGFVEYRTRGEWGQRLACARVRYTLFAADSQYAVLEYWMAGSSPVRHSFHFNDQRQVTSRYTLQGPGVESLAVLEASYGTNGEMTGSISEGEPAAFLGEAALDDSCAAVVLSNHKRMELGWQAGSASTSGRTVNTLAAGLLLRASQGTSDGGTKWTTELVGLGTPARILVTAGQPWFRTTGL